MPTLRIEADFVGTSTELEALAMQANGGLTPAKAVLPLEFIRKNPDDTFDGVRIYLNYRTETLFAKIIKDWTNPDSPRPDPITLTVSTSTVSGGTHALDISIPDDVYAAMQSCDWVYYQGYSVSGFLGYSYFTSTVSNVRGFIAGSLLFDSSDTTPDPYAWDAMYSSTISWSAPPDIFWTNRVLCEETPS